MFQKTECMCTNTYGGLILHMQSEAVVTRPLHPRDGQCLYTALRQHGRVWLRRHCATCAVHNCAAEPTETAHRH